MYKDELPIISRAFDVYSVIVQTVIGAGINLELSLKVFSSDGENEIGRVELNEFGTPEFKETTYE